MTDDKAKTSSERAPWPWIVGVIVLFVGATAAVYSVLDTDETIGPVRGLRLGYTASMARERLDTGGEDGAFRTESMAEDLALIWTGDDGPLRSARMEFHVGQLVAVRLDLSPDDPLAEGASPEISEASVLIRESTPGGVRVTWLARSCPTHAEEVQTVLTAGSPSDD